MKQLFTKKVLTIGIALVWLVNGFICKLLNWVPRHQTIVARILGQEYSAFATKTIGALEILMTVWILSGIKARWCVLIQVIVVATMNTIEFFVVPDLLLFGRVNAIVAAFFIIVILINEYVFGRTAYTVKPIN
jgi:hypothetical protein